MVQFYRSVLRLPLIAVLGLTALESVAQAPIIQPGAPGQTSRQISAEEASALAGLSFTEADVKFMQDMIAHHAQAVEMTSLIEERTQSEEVRTLGERISASQDDEISMMQDWLRDKNQAVTSSMSDHVLHGGAHGSHNDLMPGMISAAEMEELAQAEGTAFDTLFLRLMIKHHQGAITMVETLLAQAGSAQDPVLFEFTSEVSSEQKSEIERMTAMLVALSPDPRSSLSAGFDTAGQASLNMHLVASLPKPDGFFDPENPQGLPMSRINQAGDESDDEDAEPRPSLLNFANTDLAFAGNVLIAGNYHGFNAYDISNPAQPRLLSSVVCPGGQGDVSVIGNLLIMSVEQNRGRLDCGLQGIAETTSAERFRGIRIFDVSDFTMPVQVAAVQSCRGSHTHTVVTDPDDDNNIYVYIAGTSFVRTDDELEGCSNDSPYQDPESARFRIEVVQIPLDSPQDARIVSRPQVFADPDTGVIAGLWEGGDHGPNTQTTGETNHCHDITAFPELGLAAGACSGNGILFDISDPLNPQRLDQVVDTGFSYWHSATFNNDGTKVLFTDEWGGGSRARCRAFDPMNWGANAIFDIVDGKLEFRSYYKLPAVQSEEENCVAHNGSLIPVPGRDIFVQSWYQGGISVMDFTDSFNPVEIAYFDRGPIASEELVMGGYWSSYFYNGVVYGTEIARGLDVFEMAPSDFLSENEIAAASLITATSAFNPQQQRQLVWPTEPVVARAFQDQLRRSGVLTAELDATLTTALDQASALLENGTRDSAVANQLATLAGNLSQQGAGTSGINRTRLQSMAGTVEGLAERLR